MDPENRSSQSGVDNIAWLALGTLVGAAAAMLLAPEKGAHTRRRLAGHVKAGQQSLLDSSHDLVAKGRELYEKGREAAQEASEIFERGRRMSEANFDEQLAPEPTFERGL